MIAPAQNVGLRAMSTLCKVVSAKWFEKLPYWQHAVNTGQYPSNLGCAARVYLGPCVV